MSNDHESATPNSTTQLQARQEADPSIRKLMQEFSESFSAEVRSKLARLDGIIGKDHWASVGAYKERVIKEQLIQYVPKQFSVSTGFVLAADGDKKVLSDQVDLLIWDSAHHAPYFQDGDFVIIPPLACKAAIEVKGNLDHAQLRQGLDNLRSISRFRDWVVHGGQTGWYQTYLVALDATLKFPEAIWNTLNRMYLECPYAMNREGTAAEKVDLTLPERVQSGAVFPELWSLPWVSAIAVLGHGVIKLHHLEFSTETGKHHLAYYPVIYSATNERDNTIGVLRDKIVAGLLNPRRDEYQYHLLVHQPATSPRPNEKRAPCLFLPYPAALVKQVEACTPYLEVYKPRGKCEWTEKDALDAFNSARKKEAPIAASADTDNMPIASAAESCEPTTAQNDSES